MPKGTIKPDVRLFFYGWIDENEATPFVMTGDANRMSIVSTLDGVVEISPTKLCNMLNVQKDEGKVPLFRLAVVDPDAEVQQKALEDSMKEKEKSPELDLKKEEKDKGSKPEPTASTPTPSAVMGEYAQSKEFLDKVEKA